TRRDLPVYDIKPPNRSSKSLPSQHGCVHSDCLVLYGDEHSSGIGDLPNLRISDGTEHARDWPIMKPKTVSHDIRACNLIAVAIGPREDLVSALQNRPPSRWVIRRVHPVVYWCEVGQSRLERCS